MGDNETASGKSGKDSGSGGLADVHGMGDKERVSSKPGKNSGSGLADVHKDEQYSVSEVNAYKGGILKAKFDPSKKYAHGINLIVLLWKTCFMSFVSLTRWGIHTES